MTDVKTINEIAAVMNRYSTALDTCQWHLMNEVFTEDVFCDNAGKLCRGRDETVRFIATAIECCEKTHHMNSNLETVVNGDTARLVTKFSAWHLGKGKTKETILQALGTYDDDFVRTPDGWRIKRRVERVRMEIWIDASRPGNMADFFAAAFA